MRACLARRRLRMYPPEFGNSTMSVTMPLDQAGPAVESLGRLLTGIGYNGLFDAEFKYDHRDGQFKVLEVNARPWWQLEIAAASGLDLCLMAYRDALGLPFAAGGDYHVGRMWVHPVPDLRAWWAGRRAGRVAGSIPPRAFFGAANAVFSLDDPKPLADELGRRARNGLAASVDRLRARFASRSGRSAGAARAGGPARSGDAANRALPDAEPVADRLLGSLTGLSGGRTGARAGRSCSNAICEPARRRWAARACARSSPGRGLPASSG